MSRAKKKGKDIQSASIRITYRYLAYPTDLQEYRMENWLNSLCGLYNGAVAQRKESCRITGKSVTYGEQQNELPGMKKADPALRMVHSQVLQDCLQRVDKAYDKFFTDIARKKSGEKIKAGYPRFKKPGRYVSFTYPQVWMKQKDRVTQAVKFRQDGSSRNAVITLPGIGEVKTRLHRQLDWSNARTVTVKRSPSGKWYVCVSVEVLHRPSLPDNGKNTGVDVGVLRTATVSDGSFREHPKFFCKSEKKLKKAQKTLSRKEPGRGGYRKQKLILAKRHEKIANQRKDFLHKMSLWLVVMYSYIAFEKLNIQAMAKNPHLAKAILDAGWGTLIRFVTYKSMMLRGNDVIRVNPAYTTQDCSRCGSRVPKTLAERMHRCPQCGLEMDRDQNAANVIELRAFGSNTVGQVLSKPAEEPLQNDGGDGVTALGLTRVSLVVDSGSPV